MKSNDAAKHVFYSEMAKLLEAGFGIRDAAGVMSDSGLPAEQARLLDEMHRGLNEGKTIADSLGGNRDTVSDLERGIITAGERGGRLGTAMRHLADYFGMLAAARRDAIKSMIHPAIVLHLGIFIATVPSLMLEPGATPAGMAIRFFTTLIIAYAIVFVVVLACRAVLRSARSNPGTDAMLRRIPLLGKARTNLAMAGFCKVYHTCLLAGMPMRETVRMSAAASQSGLLRDASTRLEKILDGGNPLGPGMVAEPAFPKAFARSYSTGEAAGTLDTDLANWSQLFQNDAAAGSRTLAAVVPKILYFIILIYVGWKIVGFYDSYYGSLFKELEP